MRVLILLFSLLAAVPDSYGQSASITVDRGDLVHTRMLTGLDGSFGDIVGQIAGIARAHDAGLSDVAKLNLYVANYDSPTAKSIPAGFTKAWPKPGKQPALTITPSALPGGATLAADAVIAAKAGESTEVTRFERESAVLPRSRDIIYLSGRAASGELAEATAATMTQLFEDLKLLESDKRDVVQVKAFITPMTSWETVEAEIDKSFGAIGSPPTIFVEWSSGSRATEIELIAAAPKTEKPTGPISYFTPPNDKSSPVFSRVARVHGDQVIYISGVTGSDGTTPESEIHSLFAQLEKTAKVAGSDLRHFAKATYYVSESEVSKALNVLRPEYYDPKRPPSASKVEVPTIGISDRGILIDMIGVPVSP